MSATAPAQRCLWRSARRTTENNVRQTRRGSETVMTFYITTKNGLLEIESPREPQPLPDNRLLVFDFAGRPSAIVDGRSANQRNALITYEDEETLFQTMALARQLRGERPLEWLQ